MKTKDVIDWAYRQQGLKSPTCKADKYKRVEISEKCKFLGNFREWVNERQIVDFFTKKDNRYNEGVNDGTLKIQLIEVGTLTPIRAQIEYTILVTGAKITRIKANIHMI